MELCLQLEEKMVYIADYKEDENHSNRDLMKKKIKCSVVL